MPIRSASQVTTVRHAFVTGAFSGIDRAIAGHLLADGWRVMGPRRTASTEPVEGLGIAQVDVMNFAWLGKIRDGLGAVDALVHVVGFMCTAPPGILYAADGTAMWRVHIDAAAFLVDRLAPRMPAGGRILLIGNHTANGAPTCSQYAATKAALVGTARSRAAELAPRGITVSAIVPGVTSTPFLHDLAHVHTPPRIPSIGRFIAPEEVAVMAALQAGEYGGAITGQQIVICGGASL